MGKLGGELSGQSGALGIRLREVCAAWAVSIKNYIKEGPGTRADVEGYLARYRMGV